MTTKLSLFLWLCGALGNAILFIIVVAKNQWRRFPVFTALAGYEAVRSVPLFYVSHFGSHLQYLKLYWALEFVDIALQLSLLLELGRVTFSNQRLHAPFGWARFAPHLTVMAAVVIAVCCSFSLPAASSTKDTIDMRASFFTSIVTCELYLLLLRTANRLKVQRRGSLMAISNGVFLWAVCSAIDNAVHQVEGWSKRAKLFDDIDYCVVIVMLAYWIIKFIRAERLSADAFPAYTQAVVSS